MFPSAKELASTDEQLKSVDFAKWNAVASEESIQKTVKALEGKKFTAYVASSKEDAVARIKSLIPKGATVFSPASTTLREVGFTDEQKSNTDWVNINAKIVAESDMGKQAEIRRKEGYLADYIVSSVCAVSETGEYVVTDLTATRVAAFLTGSNVIIVIGANKIVKDGDEAQKRTTEFCLPLESARARVAYKVPGSFTNHTLHVKGANPFLQSPTTHFIIVKEALGY